MAPKPPSVRSAPAQPWRFSRVVSVVRGPDMAPEPPSVRRAPAEPWRSSSRAGRGSAEAEAAGHEAGDEDDDGDEGHLGVIDVGEGAGG